MGWKLMKELPDRKLRYILFWKDHAVVCCWHVHSTSAFVSFPLSESGFLHIHMHTRHFPHIFTQICKRTEWCDTTVCNYHHGNLSSSRPTHPTPICCSRDWLKSTRLIWFCSFVLCFSLIFIILLCARTRASADISVFFHLICYQTDGSRGRCIYISLY